MMRLMNKWINGVMEMKKGVLYLCLVKKTSSSRKPIWKRQFRSRGSSALKRLQHRVNKTGGLGWGGSESALFALSKNNELRQ